MSDDGFYVINGYLTQYLGEGGDVVIPDSVVYINDYAFCYCGDTLTSVTFPAGLEHISCRAFDRCTGLTALELPDTVISIGSGAFRRCADLISVTIPDSVIRIEKDAFFECRGLEEVLYTGSVYDWEKIEISRGNDALNEADIYYL